MNRRVYHVDQITVAGYVMQCGLTRGFSNGDISVIPKPFDQISKADVVSLLLDRTPEGKTLEYKGILPASTPESTKKFLANVSSFANASGGDLLFGINESAGVPVDIPGLAETDLDAARLRLEQMIRDGIEPRIPGLQIRTIEGFALGPVLIVRLVQSWVAPHMVKFSGSSRFYSRNSAGKYQLDVGELRNAFAASEQLGERLQRFRTDRLSKIIAGETPVPMAIGSAMVLHILPFVPFANARYIDQNLRRILDSSCRPFGNEGFKSRQNMDGYLTYSPSANVAGSNGYCQFFRSGGVESVYGNIASPHQGRLAISSAAFENQIIESTRMYLSGLRDIGVSLPLLITLSMVGVKEVSLFVMYRTQPEELKIDRDVLLMPDVLVESYDTEVTLILRPIIDAFWNACGYERSLSYDENGRWAPVGPLRS